MIGLELGMGPARPISSVYSPPAGLGWNDTLASLSASALADGYSANIEPRDLVDPAIWNGPAMHVDGANGNDSNSGLGAADGDFSAAKKSIHAAFAAGNATGGAYRVIVQPGEFEGAAFTKNGQVEPAFPVAVLGWGGPVHYRTGPFEAVWSDAGGTYSSGITSLNRVFRTDVLSVHGLYTELERVANSLACQSTLNSWCVDGPSVHINIGKPPQPRDIAAIRNFNGARFLTHASDLYLENIHCEGGITGTLHCDAVASRNIVGLNCSFRYSSPSNINAPLDAARIRRTDGLVAFFDSDASGGAKDGWSFHDDGNGQMQVLLSNCTGYENGAFGATSCNAVTAHDDVVSAVIGGNFGYSRNGAEVHVIQNARAWVLGAVATARDPDGSCVAFKCSNTAMLWLERTRADAAGGAISNLDIEANGGAVFVRDHVAISGTPSEYSGGTITEF
jgi:hypothetical protein